MANKLAFYKGVVVGKGSTLDNASSINDSKQREKEMKKVFDETSKRYEALYSAEDRMWFSNMSKMNKPDTRD